MSLKIRRGTDAQRLAITPDEGELVYTTDTKALYMGDGSTVGGNNVSTASAGGLLVLLAQKSTAGTINKGEPCYITGWDVGAGVVEVELADSSAAATMPALGIANEAITNSVSGELVISGEISNVNTASYSVNDSLFVDTTAGQLTNTRPTGATDSIQAVARVTRSHASNGVYVVQGAGRTNALPQLSDESIWIGDANNQGEELKWNTDATTNPGVTDDSASGYAVGSRWLNVTLDNEYVCLDATASAAVWKLTTAAGGAEVNDLESVCTGIVADEVPVGSGAGVATYTGTTGSGNVVRATSPTLVTPALGTPASGNLSNCTAYEGTAVASTGEVGGNKYLREDGDGTCSWQTVTATETNNLAVDGVVGIADDQVVIGSGAGTAAYHTLPNGAVTYATATNTVSQAASTDLSDTANIVLNNQGNTYSTGAQDFSSATSLTVPTAAGAAPTASGQIAYDSTANQLEYGDNATNRIVVNTDEAQTLTTKTIDLANNTVTMTEAELEAAVSDDNPVFDGDFAGNGLCTRTAAGTYTNRSIDGTTNNITVTNQDGVSGNPKIQIHASYAGQATITTLGTIATGTWQGTTIAVDQGGTGQTSYTNGQLLIGNTTGNTLAKGTLTGDTNEIAITNGGGSINVGLSDTCIVPGSLAIPNGAGGTTVDAAGEVCVDTTPQAGSLNYHDGTAERAIPGLMKAGFTLPDPALNDLFGIFITEHAITVREIKAICEGGTSCVLNIEYATTVTAAGTLIDQITPTTAITTETTITSASVAADQVVSFNVGTVTGTVNSVTCTIYYTVDP